MAFLVARALQVATQMADAQESLARKGFLEVAWFREQLDAHGGPVGCTGVALVAPEGQLRRPQRLVRELSRCRALRGCPNLFLLLSSAPGGEWGRQGAGDGCSAPWKAAWGWGGPRASTGAWASTTPPPQSFQEELLDAHGGPGSCALVALMAHGGQQGQLLGADGQEMQPEALVQELSHCRTLRGHPKVFLLQACRGGHRDPGVGPAALPWFGCWMRAPPAIPSHADVLQIHAEGQGSSSRDCTLGDVDQADTLTVYAAAEGCVAYRDEKGSDFIQGLVGGLRADPRGDLLELLTEVNRRVCELDVLGPDCAERRKACLETRSSLRRRLCLRA